MQDTSCGTCEKGLALQGVMVATANVPRLAATCISNGAFASMLAGLAGIAARAAPDEVSTLGGPASGSCSAHLPALLPIAGLPACPVEMHPPSTSLILRPWLLQALLLAQAARGCLAALANFATAAASALDSSDTDLQRQLAQAADALLGLFPEGPNPPAFAQYTGTPAARVLQYVSCETPAPGTAAGRCSGCLLVSAAAGCSSPAGAGAGCGHPAGLRQPALS